MPQRQLPQPPSPTFRFIEEGKFAVTATMSAEELGEAFMKEDKWITLALSIENTVNPEPAPRTKPPRR